MTDQDEFPFLLTADDVAKLLRASRDAVYARVARGSLPGVTHVGRSLFFYRDDLLRWLDERRAPSPEE